MVVCLCRHNIFGIITYTQIVLLSIIIMVAWAILNINILYLTIYMYMLFACCGGFRIPSVIISYFFLNNMDIAFDTVNFKSQHVL